MSIYSVESGVSLFWCRLSHQLSQRSLSERTSIIGPCPCIFHYNDVIMSAMASQINHRRLHCLLKCWFRRRSKKTSKLRATGLCAGNSPVTGEFPALKVSNAENVSISWRHHVFVAKLNTHQNNWKQRNLPAKSCSRKVLFFYLIFIRRFTVRKGICFMWCAPGFG